MERFHTVVEQKNKEITPGLNVGTIDMYLVDERNKRVSEERLKRAFETFAATGYHVKIRTDVVVPKGIPAFAVVEDIEGDTVTLVCEDSKMNTFQHRLSREDFHKYYEVD